MTNGIEASGETVDRGDLAVPDRDGESNRLLLRGGAAGLKRKEGG